MNDESDILCLKCILHEPYMRRKKNSEYNRKNILYQLWIGKILFGEPFSRQYA